MLTQVSSFVYANVTYRKGITYCSRHNDFSDFKVPPGYRLVLEEMEKPKPEADPFDFSETLIYYMLPSFFIFLAIALVFYLFHPYTTDDKCLVFQHRLVSNTVYCKTSYVKIKRGNLNSTRKADSNRTSIWKKGNKTLLCSVCVSTSIKKQKKESSDDSVEEPDTDTSFPATSSTIRLLLSIPPLHPRHKAKIMKNRETVAISAKWAGKQLISDNLGQGQHARAIVLTHRNRRQYLMGSNSIGSNGRVVAELTVKPTRQWSLVPCWLEWFILALATPTQVNAVTERADWLIERVERESGTCCERTVSWVTLCV